MADLTIGDVGITLQAQLMAVDQSQNPPVQTPLDLTNASQVQMEFLITDQTGNFAVPNKTVNMGILTPPSNGIVFYSFQTGDLVKPPNMGKNGVFKYFIRVTFNNGNIFTIANDQQLTIKDDSIV